MFGLSNANWFSERQYGRISGLTLLLPHGYEGQGPEHSSARPERFLELSANYNMIVANITTPSNFFHLLRRQTVWNFRKPCIVMSPKSLLRHPECVSPLKDFGPGTRFRELIDALELDYTPTMELWFLRADQIVTL